MKRSKIMKNKDLNYHIQTTINKLKNGIHVTIVALGDSITANTLHNRGHMNWVSLLDEAIFETYGEAICTIINSGIPGTSYSTALKRLDRDVLRFDPDLVIIALGMNDGFKGNIYLPEFRKEVRKTIKIIRAKCKSDILIMTPNPIVSDTGGHWSESMSPGEVYDLDSRHDEYSKALCEIANKENCAIVDHYSAWKDVVFLDKLKAKEMEYQYKLWPRMANSTHPGPLGHLVFYRELSDVLGLPKYFSWER